MSFDLSDFYHIKRIADRQVRMDQKLDRILTHLNIIEEVEFLDLERSADMSAAIDRITASVTDIKSKDDSLIALVGTIAQELRDANTANDPAINALADQLDAESAKVLEAVNANTTP